MVLDVPIIGTLKTLKADYALDVRVFGTLNTVAAREVASDEFREQNNRHFQTNSSLKSFELDVFSGEICNENKTKGNMSLDLHIISQEPVKKHGTGVYIRENGQTLELKTMEEVRAHFPGKDLSHIHEFDYEDENFWHGNITHNMGEMACEVPVEGTNLSLYDLLWQPEDHGFNSAGSPCYRELVLKGYLYLRAHRQELLPLNPDNGWGHYDLLLTFTEDFLLHLIRAGDDCRIEAGV